MGTRGKEPMALPAPQANPQMLYAYEVQEMDEDKDVEMIGR